MSMPGDHRRIMNASLIAQDSIAVDIEHEIALESDEESVDEQQQNSKSQHTHSLANFYRRPSTGATSSRLPILLPSRPDHLVLSADEREQLEQEQITLLVDSDLLPHRTKAISSGATLVTAKSEHRSGQPASSMSGPYHDEEQSTHTERSPLLPTSSNDPEYCIDSLDLSLKWEEAVLKGLIKTTWQRESKVLARNTAPLIITSILQYSLTVASMFAVGHIGKVQLGAVSLASMTAVITGYSVYNGLVTSLDTLCAQAYGSGRLHLVGIQLQRMTLFLLVATVPISVLWLNAIPILQAIVPERETATIAGQYLKIVLLGAPGYAAFEAGKRYVQAQGLYEATLYVLLLCSPLNVFMHWLFIWHFKWGAIGAPIAIAITDNLLPLCLFLYVYFVNGKQCWGGFSRAALRNWTPMVKLAIPGLAMIIAESLAFEFLTLAASHISVAHLAAQSILSTIAVSTFQLPFPMSIAASTRIATFIGATLADAAKTASKVAVVAAFLVGVTNIIILWTTRHHLPYLFTNDAQVAIIVAEAIPVCVAFQLFDSLAAVANGILRAIGRQAVGGYVNLFAYYAIAMPISISTGFGLKWGLKGLWFGPSIALFLVSALEGIFIYRTSWQKAVEDAQLRNALS